MTDSCADPRAGLRADCARCAGLCCIVPSFAASADFAIDKPPGRPCPNLLADDRCGIHDRLTERGFPGCVTFDCFGAGQQVVQVTFGGTVGDDVGRVFEAMRPLQELRWYLVEARERLGGLGALADEVDALDRRVADLTAADPGTLAVVDTAAWRCEGGELLGRVSAHVRAGRAGTDRAGADLMGADLRRTDLRGVSLRGAYLIGADLRGTDLSATDLLGADLRAADLRGADLRAALFLTAPQVEAARGDVATRLPAHLARPTRWAMALAPRSGARPGRRRR